jgi:hypothetical protein
MAPLEFRLAETLGGTAKPGWSPRKGRRFEFLPRRKRCRNTADQPFLLLMLESAVFMPGWCFRWVALASQGGNSTARKVGKFSYADAGQMRLYLNYACELWMKPGENPPVGLILCAEKGAAEAHYSLDNLRNKVLAASIGLSFQTKNSSPRNLNAPAGAWRNGRLA